MAKPRGDIDPTYFDGLAEHIALNASRFHRCVIWGQEIGYLHVLFRVWVPSSKECRKRVESNCLHMVVHNGFDATTRWLAPRLQARNQDAIIALFGVVDHALVDDFADYIADKVRLVGAVILKLPRQYDLVNLESNLSHVEAGITCARDAKMRMLQDAVPLYRMDVLDWLMHQGMDEGNIQEVLRPFENPAMWPMSKPHLARPHPHTRAMIAFFAKHTCSLTRALTDNAIVSVGLRPLVPTSIAELECFVDEIGGVVAIMPHLLRRLSIKKCDPSWFTRVYDAWDATVEANDEKLAVQMASLKRNIKMRVKFKVVASLIQDVALLTRLAQVRSAGNVAVVQWLTHRQVVQGRTLVRKPTLAD
ncbi:Aste57867_1493 [Aphanomyces stellatus]|uniref:Aste57867_1493 protein n=1 Tax=Aphanomyces stellatus TaxID=120398 RepID=A0A485K8R8_9STRA|nr:hypothetical protein As57867_001492 [Aphanomyces stellatus]VFT78709.1 Aste57867_1493 [Aphanomyces stellatus]